MRAREQLNSSLATLRRRLVRRWRWPTAVVAGLAVFGLVAFGVLELGPDLFAETEGLDAKERADARQDVRTASLALLAGAIAVVGAFYTARTFTLNRAGQLTDRFSKAIEQLGNKELDVRLGGIYALERIARDSEDDHPQVMEVLTAYVREHARRPVNGDDVRPATDVQAALTVLGRRTLAHEQDTDWRLDLSSTDLAGANLGGARLHDADLSSANLHKANLSEANLSEALLISADLSEARAAAADLSQAILMQATLRSSHLRNANLSGADFSAADLTGAALRDADLRHATLFGTNLHDAVLARADLTDAMVREANITAADLSEADLSRASLIGANLSGANLSRANLTGANLTGATYRDTTWPEDFDPDAAGALLGPPIT